MLSTTEESLAVCEINLDIQRSEISYLQEIEWNYKDGPVTNINSLAQEFMKYRGLLTTRVCILGAPAAGKSLLGNRLSEIYNLPVISTKDVIDQILSLVYKELSKVRIMMFQRKSRIL